MGLTEAQLLQLRRKLEALGYVDTLEASSGVLVQKLTDDLVHTTDSYRTLKLQCARQCQELAAEREKVEALKQESSKLQAENSQLHLQLIKAKEGVKTSDVDAYQQCKKLEDRIAELSFWKQTAADKMRAAEKENAQLKVKVQELLTMTDQLSAGTLDPQATNPRISLAAPPSHASLASPAPPPPPAPSQSTPQVDVLQAANARMASLQQQLADRDSQVDSLRSQLETAKVSISQREVQIGKLGLKAGADAQVVALSARNEANESMILQLNRCVDGMAEQIKQLEGAARDKQRLETAISSADRLRQEAEDKLRRAVKENEAIQHEVLQLRADISMLQTTNTQANVLAAAEVDTALSSASSLRARLADSRAEQDRLKALLELMAGERSAAMSQVMALERELSSVKSLLADMQSRADEYRNEAGSTKSELLKTKEKLLSKELALEELQRKVAGLSSESETRKRNLDKTDAERQNALTQLDEVRMRLESLETSASNEHTTNLQLATQLSRTESELRAAQTSLSMAENEIQSLRKQLREVQEERVKTQGNLSSTEEERSRVVRELSSATSRAAELQGQVEQLMSTKTQLEVECSRLKSDVSVMAAESKVLQERLDTVTEQLHQGQAAWNNTHRELTQLQGLPTRVEDLQEQLRSTVVRLSGAEAEGARARAEASRTADQLTRTEAELREARRFLDTERELTSGLKAQLSDLEQVAAAASAHARNLEADRDSLMAQHRLALSDASALREALTAEGNAAQQADSAARDLQARLASAGKQLAIKEEEVSRLNSLLSQAQASADASRAREEDARTSSRELAERARKAEALAAEYQSDLAQVSAARQRLSAHVRELEGSLVGVRRELEERRLEVEQLTTLSLRGDATVQECTAHIKAMSSDLKAAEMRISDLISEISARDDTVSRLSAEVSDLRRVVAGLDAERDALQAELDVKAEQCAAMSAQLDGLSSQSSDTQRLLAMAEGRLAHADARARDGEAESSGLRSKVEAALDLVRSLTGERDMLQRELAAISVDLEALVKENQVVSSELASASQQRDALTDELRRTTGRSTTTEQMLRAKDAEVEDLRRAYESLALENRRLQGSISSLERESTSREASLSQKDAEVSSLHEALRAAQSQSHQYVMDLQAFERQVDALSRQLAQSEAGAEESSRDRQVLVEELKAAQQVRLSLERHREELQRQVAALDSQLAVSRARLEDATAETTSLNQRLVLERNRQSELESLLAGMRAREYKSDLVTKHGGSQLAVMQERNRVLEEQVTSLQHQITGLQQSRDVQDRELTRLRNEAMALAAAAAAEEGAGSAAAVQAAEMSHRVLDLETSCARLQAELLTARKDASAAREATAAAQGELLDLRLDNQSLRGQVDSLESQVKEMSMVIESRSSSSSRQGVALVEEQLTRLQLQLKDEQSKRRQAEKDFIELMSSIEGEGEAGGGLTHNSLVSRRLADMQLKIAAVEAEKAGLEEHMAKTRSLMLAMQAELQHIQVEYGVASSSLSELIGTGLGLNMSPRHGNTPAGAGGGIAGGLTALRSPSRDYGSPGYVPPRTGRTTTPIF